jgi:hypothetical protein
VRNVILGRSGVLEGLRSGGVVVDMTTSEPSLALEIYNEAKNKGVHSIDAPVSGPSSNPTAPCTKALAHELNDPSLQVETWARRKRACPSWWAVTRSR